MPIRLVIKPDRKSAQEIAAALKRLQVQGQGLRGPLGRTGLFVMREARRRLRSRTREWGPGTFRLSKSLAQDIKPMSVEVGSNLVYAAIQQLGGTVTPKRTYLAIPVPPSLRRRGVWPRDLPADQLKFYVANHNVPLTGDQRWLHELTDRKWLTLMFEGDRGGYNVAAIEQLRTIMDGGQTIWLLTYDDDLDVVYRNYAWWKQYIYDYDPEHTYFSVESKAFDGSIEKYPFESLN